MTRPDETRESVQPTYIVRLAEVIMRWHRVARLALLTLLSVASGLLAERAPEERDQATHVVVGTVEGVYVREVKETHHYLVEIAIEKVEKGGGVKAGERFYAHCYLWNNDYHKGKK